MKASTNSLGTVGLLLFVGVAVVPIAFSLGYAAAYSVGAVGLLSDGLTPAYWARLFERTEVWASFGLSLYVAGCTVLLTVSLALLLALYLRRPLQQGALSYVIYFPLALPATVAAFLVYQVFSGAGLLSRMALGAGLIDGTAQFPGLVNDPYAVGIITAHVSLAVPFFVLLFVQIYRSERVDELLRLAATLGAGRRAGLYRVAVPILLNRAFTNVLLLFVAVLGSYEIPLLLGRQHPQMLSVLTLRKYALFDISQKPEAFIVALLYTGLVVGCIVAAYRRGRLTYEV